MDPQAQRMDDFVREMHSAWHGLPRWVRTILTGQRQGVTR